MKFLLLFIFAFSPIKEVENVKLALPTQQYEIFVNYSNLNFSQEIVNKNKSIVASIESSNYHKLNLEFRVIPNWNYINQKSKPLKKIIKDLLAECISLKIYLANISFYLRRNIKYTEMDLPQDATAVIFNKRANCVGFSNLVKVFLDSASIKNNMTRGFYLKEFKENTFVPVPHRWVEIYLPNGLKFFYDPQYQSFSANYILTKEDVNFKRVRKFKAFVLNKTKKIIN